MSNIRIIVTDDDPAVQKFVMEVAAAQECGVAIADDLETFQEQYNTFNPTLIFLDLNLKHADGIEVIRFLSEAECECPIYIMSAQDEKVLTTVVHLGKERGLNMQEAIQKPISMSKLQAILKQQDQCQYTLDLGTLHQAVHNDEFYFHYQPTIDVKTKKIIGAEALSRWTDSGGNQVPPIEFITLAEKTGFIRVLSRYLVEKTFKQISEQHLDINVSINLSARDLVNIRLPDEMTHLLEKYPIDPRKITFEITETALMSHYKIVMDILSRFRIMGFSLSLDDFGTGYSSLVELYKLPFSELKIDRSFVMRLPEDKEALVIVNSIITLGHNLGVKVIAEGVESQAALTVLEDLGCDIAQGFFISKPIDMPMLLEFIKKQNN